jgi:hypothetical protein
MKELVASIYASLLARGDETNEPTVESSVGDFLIASAKSGSPVSVSDIYAHFGLQGS